MLRISLKQSVAPVAVVVAGAFAATGSANADTHRPGLVVYNGHAGLGASLYEHAQTDREFLATASWRPRAASDGTSNTLIT